MRVFVTGATGFIGSAVVQDLLQAGHQVLGLARSDAKADALAATGAQVHRGDLGDLDSLRAGAKDADGVVHCAFIHDFSNYVENGQVDKRAILAMGEVLAGTNRPLIATSGLIFLAQGQVATEDMAPPGGDFAPRVSEQTADAVGGSGVRTATIRLSPTVHGAGDQGFVPALIGIARAKGVSAYVGDGTSRWPAVHRLDAARLYRLILENEAAAGHFHGVAEEGVSTKTIAETIGRKLGLPVVSKSPEEASEHFGFLGMFFGLDSPASSTKTQMALGWRPTGPDLLSDMEAHYFG